MAEKISKSILRNLDGLRKMLHRDSKKPSGSAPKPIASKESARERGPSPPSVGAPPDQEGAQEAAEAKPDKKKTKNQPWYRHRQRW
jgi:hypothetical protein